MTQDAEKLDSKPKNDLPTLEQQKELEETLRKILNPNGENKQMDEYLTSTFNYISNAFEKMQNAPDSEKSAQEIAQDLKTKFEGWVRSQEAKQKQQEDKIEDTS